MSNPGADVLPGTDEDSDAIVATNTHAVYSVLRSGANALALNGRLINIGSPIL